MFLLYVLSLVIFMRVLDFCLLGVWLFYVGFSISKSFISLTVFIPFIFTLIVQMYLTTFLLKFLFIFLKLSLALFIPFQQHLVL